MITGIGVLAPNGNHLEDFWEATLQGVSGLDTIRAFDASDYPVNVAGEIKGFHLEDYTRDLPKYRRLARSSQLGVAATVMALKHAGITRDDLKKDAPVPVMMGLSTSAIGVVEEAEDNHKRKGPEYVRPYTLAASQPHACVNSICEYLQVETRRSTLASACPAGMDAIIQGAEWIRSGRSDVVLTGGVDSSITPLSMATFSMAGLAGKFTLPPDRCSRPFDKHREGGVISEGIAVFVLEEIHHARMRGGKPLAELLGSAMVTDHKFDEPGSGFDRTMKEALANSGLVPSDVGYISAHGPSHPILDVVESKRIQRVFGRLAGRIPVSSIKGVIGNPVSAAGPLQVASCVQAMQSGLLPPTANLEDPDPECELNHIMSRAIRVHAEHILVNVHGMGGGNSSAVLRMVNGA
ncbi:MAG TPA: beta-ketoacyl-[acyl-carrier-protein] synthase family protein [Kiritimatiellia bacterium]|nr:beta-ketoacyl-[acyl-carrier-protein] synthase family protein [Kiritimatiellia bacterium]